MERSDHDDSGQRRIVLWPPSKGRHVHGSYRKQNLVDIILEQQRLRSGQHRHRQPIRHHPSKSPRVRRRRGRHVEPAGEVDRGDEGKSRGDEHPGSRRKVPVLLLGGAALTRSYVETTWPRSTRAKCITRGPFEGLKVDGHHHERQARRGARKTAQEAIRAREKKPNVWPAAAIQTHCRAKPPKGSRGAGNRCRGRHRGPGAAVLGSRIVRSLAVADYTGLLDERALFWASGVYAASAAVRSVLRRSRTEGRPRLRHWLDRLSTDGILAHAILVYIISSVGATTSWCSRAPSPAAVRYRFHFPRQQRGPGFVHCRFHPLAGAGRRAWRRPDVLPFQLVTWVSRSRISPTLVASTPTATTWRCTVSACSSPGMAGTGTSGSVRAQVLRGLGDGGRGSEAKEDYFKLGSPRCSPCLRLRRMRRIGGRAKMMALLGQTHRCDVARNYSCIPNSRPFRPAPSGSKYFNV